jgi:hypothetical protein
MPFVQRRRDEHEEESEASGLVLDIEERACPTCGRFLHPWEPTCPDDGSAAVERSSIQRMEPPPAHLLEEEE